MYKCPECKKATVGMNRNNRGMACTVCGAALAGVVPEPDITTKPKRTRKPKATADAE